MLASGQIDGATMSASNGSKRQHPSRRSVLMASVVLGAGAGVLAGTPALARRKTAYGGLAPIPMPAQVPIKDDHAVIAGTRLWYWDTGGDGEPIVLLHPATGSALIWGYQQPVFAKAGFRVIAYSRRGYYNSASYDKNNPGIGSVDLHNLVERLGVRKFHLVASAAGGSIASDYAFSHPDRLMSLTISSNSLGVRDGTIAQAAKFIRPEGWDAMPAAFRELGPSYRAANPDGVKHWMELELNALTGVGYRQKLQNTITQAMLKDLKVPTLLISGAADLSTPPAIARMIAAEIPGSELVVAPEAGHSVYWERPDVFNQAVLDFAGKH
jgi:pimeloyl-ACP methyl ester carboxylesterase